MTTSVEELDLPGKAGKLRIAIEGCGHGSLDSIYNSVEQSCRMKGWGFATIDFLIICGDFQAVRNALDLKCMNVPVKYREIGDFHKYYSGEKTAPLLTLFIGGNHEASNYLFELYHGGWAAPNIYYLGAANVIRYGPLRIAALSGIWKGYDYRKPHFERLPYNRDDINTIYHVREYDVRKLLQIQTQLDIGISHDWPRGVELSGNFQQLFAKKRGFREDSETGKLGSVAAEMVLSRLRPPYWFSGHLHVKFPATVEHQTTLPDKMAPRIHSAGAVESRIPQTTIQVQNEDEIDILMSDSDEKSTAPAPARLPPAPTGPVGTQAKLGAWNIFHQKAQKEEAEESKRTLAELAARREEERRTGVSQVPQVKVSETWRRVEVGEGTSRSVVEAKKRQMGEMNGPEDDYIPSKMQTNEDEIQVDLSNSSGEDKPKNTKDEIGGQAEEQADKAEDDEGAVPADVRAQLPESFTKASSPPIQRITSYAVPAAITNLTTRFLALDKVGADRDFLQIIEVDSLSESSKTELRTDTNESASNVQYSLQYDAEWLAICRYFGRFLVVGDESAAQPPNLGEAQYAVAIAGHLEWVNENIVKKGRLDVPINFSVVAPVYDEKMDAGTLQQPKEYPNPQTEAFCQLLQIENKLVLSDAEQEARMQAGPRPDKHPFNNNARQGRGGGWRGQRGRSRSGGGGSRGGQRGNFRGGYGTNRSQFSLSDLQMPRPEEVKHGSRGRGGRGALDSRGDRLPSSTLEAAAKPTTTKQDNASIEGSWASLPMPAFTRSAEDSHLVNLD